MQKIVFILVFSAASFVCLQAQFALKGYTFNAAGNTWSNDQRSLQYAVGSPVVLNNTTGGYHVTSGVLQPFIRQKEYTDGLLIKAFPNPVKNLLYIKIITDSPAYFTISVFNTSGGKMDGLNPVLVSGVLLKEIDFSGYEQGLYLILITAKDGSFQKTIRVGKTG